MRFRLFFAESRRSLSLAGLTRSSAAMEAAERLVRKAFAQGFVNIVTPGSQLSPSSLEIKWEEELRSTIKGALELSSHHIRAI